MPEALEVIPMEKAELERLERIIRAGIVTFHNVGDALIQIREKKYYRNVLGFQTFEEYCQTRWSMGKSHAYRLIEATEVLKRIAVHVWNRQHQKETTPDTPDHINRPRAAAETASA